ncbi:MAG: glycosyltransferase family 2 protein [Acidobacteriota bacterium]|nr:glycosyltransferase family 2 protein [Acidobacteriota bacterium]
MTQSDFNNHEMPENQQYPACLSVVVPVYNEVDTLEEVVSKVLGIPCLLEVIIVDDGSTDGTSEVAHKLAAMHPQVSTVRHSRNAGKTAALRTGFALTQGRIVIVQDADLEYDPAEIYGVIRPILEGHADVVYGSRFLVRRAARVLYFYHFLANKFLTFLSNALTNLNMTDIETGYKAFRGDIIRNMVIVSSGFGFEVEVTAKVAKLRTAIYEVPISYYGRTYQEGKKIGLKDGVIALWFVFRFNLLWSPCASFRQLPELGSKLNRHPPERLRARSIGSG